MATNSVSPSPAQNSSPELANTEHWLDLGWKKSPLNPSLKFALKTADRATKGAQAVARALHRDHLARTDLADCPGELAYPLLDVDDHDRLFLALECLIAAAEGELDRVRENLGGVACFASKEKANG